MSIGNCRNTYKDCYRDKYRDKYRDDSFDGDRGRSREKQCLHNTRKDNGFVSNNLRIEWLHKVLKQLSPYKVVAIQFKLASSINFDDVFDSIHSTEDVDHLIAERISYVKSQIVENLAEDKSDENSSSINSQNYINHVIDEPIDCQRWERYTFDARFTEKFNFINDDDIPIELIERKVDNYSIELSSIYTWRNKLS